MPLLTVHRSTAKRAAVNTALLCLAGLVSLGLGELVVRGVAPQQLILLRPDIWRPLDTLGWGHQPNIDVQVNTGERTVRMITGDNGFRVGAGGRPDGDVRILLLGDSFMAAMQVEHEQSLAGLIERCLESQGVSAAVWNTGVGAWDPPHYLLQARRALRSQRFDLVLVSVFLGNDVVPERREYFPPRQPVERATFRIPESLEARELINALLAPVNDGLETRSHLFVLMKTGFQGLLMRLGLTAVHVPTELRRQEADSKRWAVTADILADIDSLALDHGIPSMFVLMPAVQQVDEELLRRHVRAFGIDPASLDVNQPGRLLLRETERRGLRVVSATEALREAFAEGVEPYGRVDTHLSAEGHRVVWNLIDEPLMDVFEVSASTEGKRDIQCVAP